MYNILFILMLLSFRVAHNDWLGFAKFFQGSLLLKKKFQQRQCSARRPSGRFAKHSTKSSQSFLRQRPKGDVARTVRGFAFGRDFEAQKPILLLKFN
ncbi:hypothetical protein DRF68_20075 [Candidatus Chryseobacterium massiliae]|uniref:Uncharacterized protein n=1 Tax=Candidatus Chryseobacterium massiliense TaxID=204089 RepID=A0A3D9AGF5_9FLAO|nr:hypothetical protein DRF68_20075 [Candidatus Chryseobacterium massiliae]